ncbi:alpha/beta hydrolase [Raoultibacter massiliensis]|uniref:Alpha/beta fold hydrolase n=1 Tax=Raoultibacter massiliensis TaxID=1852371 RepID=A0ABV1JDU3_9ACTN|nr:alpha/beta fold hydrolase [Raoultibacter massiliensis]
MGMKRTAGIVAACGAALAALYGASVVAIGNACIDYALVPGKDGKTGRMRRRDRIGGDLANGSVASDVRDAVEQNRRMLFAKRDAWLERTDVEQVRIRASTGVAKGGICGAARAHESDAFDLSGFIYPASDPSDRWVLLVHGYTNSHHDVEYLGARYAAHGYNVLAPDLRAHGQSGGDLIGMGWTDRCDLLLWIDYLIGRFGADVSIVLHGVSMGAAAACMASGEIIPAQVKAVVSDCAFTDLQSMLAGQVKKLFGLPRHPVVDDARIMLKARGGYDIKHASALEQVKKSITPTLFIHGSSDGFIPASMARELFEACRAPEKRLLVVAGAGHALSAQTDPSLYFDTVFDFLEKKAG